MHFRSYSKKQSKFAISLLPKFIKGCIILIQGAKQFFKGQSQKGIQSYKFCQGNLNIIFSIKLFFANSQPDDFVSAVKILFFLQKITAFVVFQNSKSFESSIIIIFQNNQIEMASSSLSGLSIILGDRPYQCPCKKTYKSYPALFTHIKNKHDGIPPGSIKKPILSRKRPGRPPVNFSKCSISTQQMQPKSSASIQICQQEKTSQDFSNSNIQTCIDEIVSILVSLPEQPICRQRLHEITAMMEMTVFMATKKDQSKKSIGAVIQQFFQAVTGRVEWIKFKYFYILIMLFSQFIIKQENNNRIFYDQQPDLLCSYINNFIEQQVSRMILEYKVQALSIFQRSYMLKLFYKFFEWMLLKQYTTYRITFRDDEEIKAF